MALGVKVIALNKNFSVKQRFYTDRDPEKQKLLDNFARNNKFLSQGLKWRKCVRTNFVDTPRHTYSVRKFSTTSSPRRTAYGIYKRSLWDVKWIVRIRKIVDKLMS